MRGAMTQLNLSARAFHRILKLARTIGDLAGSEEIQPCIWRRRCNVDLHRLPRPLAAHGWAFLHFRRFERWGSLLSYTDEDYSFGLVKPRAIRLNGLLKLLSNLPQQNGRRNKVAAMLDQKVDQLHH